MKVAESISDIKVGVTRLLMATQDQALLAEIHALLLNAASGEDWYASLDEEDKASIARGQADIAAGRVHTTEEVMREARIWRK
jgi:predicted transcriptional regulator